MKKAPLSFLVLLLLLLASCGSPKGFPSGSSHFPQPHAASALVSWTASSGFPDSYTVELSSNGGASFTTVTTTTNLSANITGLITGRSYVVRVRAFNAGGFGSYSSVQISPQLSP